MTINRKPVFDAFRSILGRGFTGEEVVQIDRAFDEAEGITRAVAQIGLAEADFATAADMLGCTVAQIKAVWEVECSGSGWFTDVRGDILALDGPGGFIDGANLPKILFEAHIFARYTRGKYNLSHPNLSSPVWKRSLYVGGVGEWERLHRAMLLDREAALMSASVGAPQIMGFNHKLAGYQSVENFWEAMKQSERNHLAAFCAFIRNSGLVEELRAISNFHSACRPFAKGYNGSGYEANEYHIKIARAHKKWSGT